MVNVKYFIFGAALVLGACAQTPLDNSPVSAAERKIAFDYATFIEQGCAVRLKKIQPEAYHDTVPRDCACVREEAIAAYQPWLIRMIVNERNGIPPTAPKDVFEAEAWRGIELGFKRCGSIY